MNKILISGVLGGIVTFFLGWLFYGMLFMDLMTSYAGTATGVSKDPMGLGYIFAGNCTLGIFYAWIFSKWTGPISMMQGIQLGAMFGFFISLAMDMIGFGTTNLYTLNGLMLDVLIMIIMSAASGAVIALSLKKA